MNFNHRALVIGGERLTTPLRERYADRYPSLAQAIKAIPQFGPALGARPHELRVTRIGPDRLRVLDSRFGELQEHLLTGTDATIHDFCHAARKKEHIEVGTGLSSARVEEGLARLLERKLLYDSEGFYISLALRPRDELIQSYYQKVRGSSAATIISMRPQSIA